LAKKIGTNKGRPTLLEHTPSPIIVFGSQRIGAIYALRNGLNPNRVKLATMGGDVLKGFKGVSVTVVRVPKDVWVPPTFPCERRVAETEQALKAFAEAGGSVEDVFLA